MYLKDYERKVILEKEGWASCWCASILVWDISNLLISAALFAYNLHCGIIVAYIWRNLKNTGSDLFIYFFLFYSKYEDDDDSDDDDEAAAKRIEVVTPLWNNLYPSGIWRDWLMTDGLLIIIVCFQRELPLRATFRSRGSWRQGETQTIWRCPAKYLAHCLWKTKPLSSASVSSSRTAMMTTMRAAREVKDPSCWPGGSKRRKRR